MENAEELFDLIRNEIGRVVNGELAEEDFAAARSYALGRYQMGAQTPTQIADFYAEGYFTSEKVVKYDSVPKLLDGISRQKIIELAREFTESGVKGFAAVSSAEKAMITGLDGKLSW